MDYTLKVCVKPYVKAYLENNFGIPADVREDWELWKLVELVLRASHLQIKKETVPILLPESTSQCFGSLVELKITKDWFNRYGFRLKKRETLRLNAFLEKRIKFYSRSFIGYHHCLGMSVAESIRDFQKTFGFSEDVWPYDSIKKDFDRHGWTVGKKAVLGFRTEMSKIFLESLSETGTIFRSVGVAGKEVGNG